MRRSAPSAAFRDAWLRSAALATMGVLFIAINFAVIKKTAVSNGEDGRRCLAFVF